MFYGHANKAQVLLLLQNLHVESIEDWSADTYNAN